MQRKSKVHPVNASAKTFNRDSGGRGRCASQSMMYRKSNVLVRIGDGRCEFETVCCWDDVWNVGG
jgi:hypothetical protein